MKIWTIVKYTLLSNVRDKRSIMSYLLFPVILIVILGNALSAAFGATSLGEIKVGLVYEQENDFTRSLVNYLGEETDFTQVVEYRTAEEAKKAIEEEKVSVAVEVPSDIEESVAAGEVAVISLWTANEKSYQTTVLKTLLDVCMDATNTILSVREHGGNLTGYELKETIKEMSVAMEGNKAGAMDYYAVTILVMALMYGTAIGAREFEMNLKGEMGKRLRTSPAGAFSLLAAKILSCIVIVFVQGMLIMLLSKHVFGANWGDSPGKVVLYVLLGALFSTELGIMVSVLMNNPEKVGGILTVIVPVMTLISGGFVKTSFGGLERLMPNYQLQTLFFQTIYGGKSGAERRALVYVAVLIAVMFGVAVMAGRRKKTW